jgi:hypothetical protein
MGDVALENDVATAGRPASKKGRDRWRSVAHHSLMTNFLPPASRRFVRRLAAAVAAATRACSPTGDKDPAPPKTTVPRPFPPKRSPPSTPPR